MKKDNKSLLSSKQFKNGSYTTIFVIVIIAIVIIVNMLFGNLPSSTRKLDVSSNKIYSIGDVTKNMLDSLDSDIDIIVVAQKDKVDARIINFLEKYDEYSDNVKVSYVDPVLHPSATTEYGVSENSIVVKSEDTGKKETVALDSIIEYDQYSYYYYGTYNETAFDGEGLITSAINSVAFENPKTFYTLTGHSETDLGSNLTDLFKKNDFSTSELNLLTKGSVPDDCDMMIINQPSTDLADDELKMLEDYMAKGGRITIFLNNKVDGDLKNFKSLMNQYGINQVKGYIEDRSRYYSNSYFQIFPDYGDMSYLSNYNNSKDLVLTYYNYGLEKIDPAAKTTTVNTILTTSSEGYAYINENMENKGTYLLGAVAEDKIDDKTTSYLTVYSCPTIIDNDLTTQFTSLKNLEVVMNSITYCFDDVTNISIPSVSLEMTYNTFTNQGTLSIIMIGIIPGCFLLFGLIHWIIRRKY